MRIVTLLCLLALCCFAQQPTSSSQQLSPGDAVNIVRTINTAESIAHENGGKYQDLSGLRQSGALQQAQLRIEKIGGSHPIAIDGNHLRNYVVEVIAHADGSNYVVSMKPQETGKAFFSDAQGLIYEGAPLR